MAGESSRVSAMMEARLVRTHQRRLEEKLLGAETDIERARKRLERLAVREKTRSSNKCPWNNMAQDPVTTPGGHVSIRQQLTGERDQRKCL